MKRAVSIFAWSLAGLIGFSVILRIYHILSNRDSLENVIRQPGNLLSILVLPVFGFMAAWIISQQPRNTVGWLLFFPATTNIIDAIPYISSFNPPPEHPPFLLYLAIFYSGTAWLQLIFPLFFIPVLFPTGRLPSPRWRWMVFFALGMIAIFIFLAVFSREYDLVDLGLDWTVINPIGFIPPEVFGSLFNVLWTAGLFALAVLGVISIITRFRRAGSVERKQIKWLLFSCSLFVVSYILSQPISSMWPGTVFEYLVGIAWQLSLVGFPVAIAIAILCYRLWDIDLVIRRTLSYGLLTFLLGLVYFGGVTLFQRIFTILVGQQSPLALVLSTLLIAALFNPLRRRIQTVIDRRFFRSGYDTELILARFNLDVKNQVDGEVLHNKLVNIISESLQPDSLGLWMRRR